MRTHPNHPERRIRRGFTLLELVLVMLLIAISLSVAAPSLRGFLSGSKSRDAATHLLSVMQWARGRAAAEARIYRLNISAQDGSYQVMVQQGEQFVESPSDFGQVFAIPDGMTMQFVRGMPQNPLPGAVQRPPARAAASGVGDFIDFHPDGRNDPASVRLADDQGSVYIIESPSPAEPFRILSREETSQR
jgi:prepilin-type N-terminal cleavage/methylation domain-containing protein